MRARQRNARAFLAQGCYYSIWEQPLPAVRGTTAAGGQPASGTVAVPFSFCPTG